MTQRLGYMMLDMALIAVGFAILFFGAKALVQGSGSLALRCRISPLVIGLTVVAFGTSMPELVVSIKAGIAGQGAIAIGNVVGSNIFNVAFILGVSALLAPMKIRVQIVRLDTPLMIAASLLFVFFLRDRLVSRVEGGVLFLCFLAYTLFTILMARREKNQEKLGLDDGALPEQMKHWGMEVALIVGGLLLLVVGANVLVHSAVSLAEWFGVSEAVIGLTIVACGTSLPELATSVVAAAHKQSEIAVGNIVGSNIFNILCILGLAGVVAPISGGGVDSMDLLAMLLSSTLLLPFLWTKFELNRWEGLVLIGIYVSYILILLQVEVWSVAA